MEYVVPMLLTLLSLYTIIVVLKKIEKRILKTARYRQSDIREMLKPILFVSQNNVNKKTQMDKMLEKNAINVMVIDDQAYWVVNNIFYTAKFTDGGVDQDTATPIDVNSLSKTDMEKMFFILDKLGDGNTNDSGSSR